MRNIVETRLHHSVASSKGFGDEVEKKKLSSGNTKCVARFIVISRTVDRETWRENLQFGMLCVECYTMSMHSWKGINKKQHTDASGWKIRTFLVFFFLLFFPSQFFCTFYSHSRNENICSIESIKQEHRFFAAILCFCFRLAYTDVRCGKMYHEPNANTI